MLKIITPSKGARVSRLAALRQRHAQLAAQLERERTHRSISDVYLSELKKQKLRVKDMIERLCRGRQGEEAVAA